MPIRFICLSVNVKSALPEGCISATHHPYSRFAWTFDERPCEKQWKSKSSCSPIRIRLTFSLSSLRSFGSLESTRQDWFAHWENLGWLLWCVERSGGRCATINVGLEFVLLSCHLLTSLLFHKNVISCADRESTPSGDERPRYCGRISLSFSSPSGRVGISYGKQWPLPP